MSDERREQIRAVLQVHFGEVPYSAALIERAADQLRAVADADQDEKLSGLAAQAIHVAAAVESLTEENTRLRAELADTKRRAVNDILLKNDQISRLYGEISHLRADMGTEIKIAWQNVAEMAEHAVTIERVRAALDGNYDNLDISDLANNLFVALDGES